MTSTAAYRLISTETLPLTALLVDEHRNLPGSPTERVLDRKRVDFLRERLALGLFHPPHWVRAKVGATTYRANGMHSSTMLHECNGNLPEGLAAHLDTFECDNIDGLAMLFRQFDDRRSARTPADVAGAYQGLRPELSTVPREMGKLGVEAIAWYRENPAAQEDVPSGDNRYAIFNEREQHAFLCWLPEVFGATISREMRKAPILAAMYACFQSDRDVANDFWREVAAGGREYSEDWPTTTLADWYRRIRAKEMEVKPRNLYQGSLYAWNAVRDGKTSVTNIRADIKRNFHKAN